MDMKKIGGIAKEVAGSGVLGPVAKGIAGLYVSYNVSRFNNRVGRQRLSY